MLPSRSTFVEVRGRPIHVRRWGNSDAPLVIMLHGWMDMSITFQFVVDSFQKQWSIAAPDWSGYGPSYWQRGPYSIFSDLADLDALADHYAPNNPVFLVGHSYGGNVAGMYAGARPDRVKKAISLEGFGSRQRLPDKAPRITAKWLDTLKQSQLPTGRPYRDVDALAMRLINANPRLTLSRAKYLAQYMGTNSSKHGIKLAVDPWRRIRALPISYPASDFFKAFFERIEAPVLWAYGSDSQFMKRAFGDRQDYLNRLSAFKNAVDIKIENAGHNLHHDQPQNVASVIENFLLTETT